MVDGFLGRWSRRKADASEGRPLADAPPSLQPAAALPPQPLATSTTGVGSEPEPRPEVELPSLKDVERLTMNSDFKPFVARGVSPEVKNAAMKKLFSDPHFNVMDGLDIYIDDYSLPDPLPESMIRQMASAQFLNLFEEKEDKQQPTSALTSMPTTALPLEPNLSPTPVPLNPASTPVPAPTPEAADHDHPDL